MDNKYTLVLLIAVLMSFALFVMMQGQGRNSTLANVKIPALSLEAQIGRKGYEGSCMSCHGKNAAGTDQGPPLIHEIYEPNHHSDESFYRAAEKGVTAHHWPYGDMPPVPGASKHDLAGIIRFIRELQRANGVF